MTYQVTKYMQPLLMRATTMAALVLGVVPVVLRAQAAQHRIAPGDTVRWREERTLKTSTQVGPDLSMRTEMNQRGMLGFARTVGDTAVAWYDSLTAEMSSPDLDVRMPVPLNNKIPLRVLITGNGRVRQPDGDLAALQASMVPSQFMSQGVPTFPPILSLLVQLPTVPLAIGVTWSDSSTAADSIQRAAQGVASAGGTVYRVVRDTMVENRRSLVISVDVQMRMTVGAAASKGLTIGDSNITTSEKGIIVFDPLAGRVIGRRTTGEMRTSMKMPSPDGGARDMVMTANYEHSLEIFRP
jgi:hypothetical protein